MMRSLYVWPSVCCSGHRVMPGEAPTVSQTSFLRCAWRSVLMLCEILSLLPVTQNVFLVLKNVAEEHAFIILLPFTCCQKLTFEMNSPKD